MKELIIPSRHLVIPSPYLIAPVPLQVTDLFFLAFALNRLTDEKENQELLKSETGVILLTYRRFVAGCVYRQIIDQSFPSWIPGKSIKAVVDLETSLWIATLKMLERMQYLVPFMQHPVSNLYDMILERELMSVLATYSGGMLVAKKYIGNLQSQNRALQGCENPFDKKRRYTWEVLDKAIALANTDECFRRDFYMPVVRARQRLVIQMKKSGECARVFYEGKLQRQGRRKEPKA